MDPAVTAALIAAPVAITAAGAAFAAGLVQGRAAQRGPVDAVRRQHQRDAYATFLAALHTYEREAEFGVCERLAQAEFQAAGVQPTPTDLNSRTLELVAKVPIKEVLARAAVVELEGPEPVADAGVEAMLAVCEVHYSAVASNTALNDRVRNVLSEHDEVYPALKKFTELASVELNRAAG
ncbi:hypothetical protein [Streptomyces microflavus]|uniref:hypothetical protein n=1 Tax=Streptomyces microflavus TaxID=1919 RepID=UPI0036982451